MSAPRCVAMLLCAAIAVGVVGRVRAQDVHLSWRRPIGTMCPSADALQQDVEANLGRAVFTQADNAWLWIGGRIVERDSWVRVHLEARDVHGTLLGSRVLEAQRGSCTALRGAIVLALTLLIEHRSPPPDAPDVGLGLEGALLWHGAPRTNIGVGPALRVALGRVLELRSSAAYFWPVVLQSSRGIRATVHTVSVATRLCPRLIGRADDGLTLYACTGLQVETWLTRQSRGASASELRAQLHWLVELRAAVRSIGATRVELAVAPLLALHRVAMVSAHGDDGQRVLLYRAPPVALIFLLGFVI